jgi:hypothetical protein
MTVQSLTRDELKALTTVTDDPKASIYMPMYPQGTDTRQNPLRLKNLLQQAEDRLVAHGVRAPVARDMLAAPRELLHDGTFWHNGLRGLAVFVQPGQFRCFPLSYEVPESVYVGQRYSVRPLLPLLGNDGTYYLLALSHDFARLYRGRLGGLEPLEVPNLPHAKSEVLARAGIEREPGLQVHSASNLPAGKQAAVFHGQGGQSDMHKEDLKLYFNAVDSAVYRYLAEHREPLLVACVDYLFPVYREINRYPHLLPEFLPGNPERVPLHELSAQAWPLVERHVHEARYAAAERLAQLADTDRASHDPHRVVPAAAQGRVEVLFVDWTAQLRGRYHPDTGQVALADGPPETPDDDLLEFTALETLRHNGRVYAASPHELAHHAPLAALFRY